MALVSTDVVGCPNRSWLTYAPRLRRAIVIASDHEQSSAGLPRCFSRIAWPVGVLSRTWARAALSRISSSTPRRPAAPWARGGRPEGGAMFVTSAIRICAFGHSANQVLASRAALSRSPSRGDSFAADSSVVAVSAGRAGGIPRSHFPAKVFRFSVEHWTKQIREPDSVFSTPTASTGAGMDFPAGLVPVLTNDVPGYLTRRTSIA